MDKITYEDVVRYFRDNIKLSSMKVVHWGRTKEFKDYSSSTPVKPVGVLKQLYPLYYLKDKRVKGTLLSIFCLYEYRNAVDGIVVSNYISELLTTYMRTFYVPNALHIPIQVLFLRTNTKTNTAVVRTTIPYNKYLSDEHLNVKVILDRIIAMLDKTKIKIKKNINKFLDDLSMEITTDTSMSNLMEAIDNVTINEGFGKDVKVIKCVTN